MRKRPAFSDIEGDAVVTGWVYQQERGTPGRKAMPVFLLMGVYYHSIFVMSREV